MAFCGHQFRAGDDSDWILSTSVNFIGPTTMATQIVQQLFRNYENAENTPKKIHKPEMELTEKLPTTQLPEKTSQNKNEHLMVKKIPDVLYFENFDESQHLNGCPVKWLYNKKLLEKNRKYKVVRWCSKKAHKEEENKKEKNKNVKDKTPTEVKIHKINLIEKYSNNYNENYQENFKSESHAEYIEAQRKKLAAKLNWKLHDDSQEESPLETSSQISGRHNYLPPRPLLGLRPLLSILLAPQPESVCCSVRELSKSSTPKEKKMEASLTIQSLDLPIFLPDAKPTPKVIHSSRWGAKTNRLQKKLQIPNQVTINLRQPPKAHPESENESRVFSGKKITEKTKQKSLSTLFYELKDKTYSREQPADVVEEVIRDLAMDESLFKIKRFLNLEGKREKVREKKAEVELVPRIRKSQENLRCGRVRLFEKSEDSKKPKREENCSEKRRLEINKKLLQ